MGCCQCHQHIIIATGEREREEVRCGCVEWSKESAGLPRRSALVGSVERGHEQYHRADLPTTTTTTTAKRSAPLSTHQASTPPHNKKLDRSWPPRMGTLGGPRSKSKDMRHGRKGYVASLLTGSPAVVIITIILLLLLMTIILHCCSFPYPAAHTATRIMTEFGSVCVCASSWATAVGEG